MPQIEQLGAEVGDLVEVRYRKISEWDGRKISVSHVCKIIAIENGGICISPPLPDSNPNQLSIFNRGSGELGSCYEKITSEGFMFLAQKFPGPDEIYVQRISQEYEGFQLHNQGKLSTYFKSVVNLLRELQVRMPTF